MVVVSSAYRLKSVRNRYVIECFGGVLILSFHCFSFFIFCWYRGVCRRIKSDLFRFLFDILVKLKLAKWYLVLSS